MRPDILVVGQGLAGTLLAWELEKAGVSFAVADPGHATAATMAAAGIINPVTGRRLVKSWRIDTLLPAARATYRGLEAALGIACWHDVRVRRLFADDREQRIFATKQATGELAPFAGAGDAAGFWIEGAARVELGTLLEAARARWRKQGRFREEAVDVTAEAERHMLVIDCTGRAGPLGGAFGFVPWEFSKGEVLELAVTGLEPGVVLNRRHWLVPMTPGTAWIGATHEPGVTEAVPSAAARAMLTESARVLSRQAVVVTGQRAGVRVNLPDKHPVAGRHPRNPRLGLINGLGSKGALVGPELARQWVSHLAGGAAFDASVAVDRFSGNAPQA